MQSVETSGEENYDQYSSEVELNKHELLEKVKEKYPSANIDFNKNDEINIIDYTESGRVKVLKVGNINLSGVEARKIFGLKSTNFKIDIIDDKVKFSVIRIWAWRRT